MSVIEKDADVVNLEELATRINNLWNLKFLPFHQREALLETLKDEKTTLDERMKIAQQIQYVYASIYQTPKVQKGEGFVEKCSAMAHCFDRNVECIAFLHYHLGDTHWFVTDKEPSIFNGWSESSDVMGWTVNLKDKTCKPGIIDLSEITDCSPTANLDLEWVPRAYSDALDRLIKRSAKQLAKI